MANYVDCDINERIGYVTLNHPEKRNALSLEMLAQLQTVFDRIATVPEVGVVVVRANGPVFCSGHDLRELAGDDPDRIERVFANCAQLMQTIRALPQPVIAQVHALATAAGCQLVATCDLAVAAEEAQFATPGVRIGLFCSTPAVPLARCVPTKKAMEMLLTGEPITAHEALAAGLVNRVVPRAELAERTRDLATRILHASSYVVALGKATFYDQLTMPEPQAYACASPVMVANAQAPDGIEGISAFLQKRTPVWKQSIVDATLS